MLDKLISLIPDRKTRDVASMAGGMALLLGGRKVVGLGLFAKGAYGLEQRWREVHAFEGDLEERWEEAVRFYEETHKDPINRKLHGVAIPILLGGTAGLLLFRPHRPLWFLSASAFTLGWALSFVGHGLFEKNAPAFADDPLSFLAGPVWGLKRARAAHEAGASATDPAVNVGVQDAAA